MVNGGSKLKLKTFCAGKRESIMEFFSKLLQLDLFSPLKVFGQFLLEIFRESLTPLTFTLTWFGMLLYVNP